MLALGGPWVVMSKQVSDRNGMEVGGEDDDGYRGAGEPCSELETSARWTRCLGTEFPPQFYLYPCKKHFY